MECHAHHALCGGEAACMDMLISGIKWSLNYTYKLHNLILNLIVISPCYIHFHPIHRPWCKCSHFHPIHWPRYKWSHPIHSCRPCYKWSHYHSIHRPRCKRSNSHSQSSRTRWSCSSNSNLRELALGWESLKIVEDRSLRADLPCWRRWGSWC